MASLGKKTPDRNIIGKAMTFAMGAAVSSLLAHPEIAKPMLMKTPPPINASTSTASGLPARCTSKKKTATLISITVCSTDTTNRVDTWAKRKLTGGTGVARRRRRMPCLFSCTKAKATLNRPICMIDIATTPGTRKSIKRKLRLVTGWGSRTKRRDASVNVKVISSRIWRSIT